MILYKLDTPDEPPYVYGITVFDPVSGAFVHPYTWNKVTITWNAANFSWEAAF